MVVAYRNVTREILASADTVVAIEPGTPCEEHMVYRRKVAPMHETARVVVVLLGPGDTEEQFRCLRNMVVEVKSRSDDKAVRLTQLADALEWIEGPNN